MKKITIKNIYSGKEKIYTKDDKTVPSSYKKQGVDGQVFLSYLGLENDNQSNKQYHGGKQQALCVFCQKDYEYLQQKYHLTLDECSFGENITLLDVSDEDFCVGDVFKCGEAVFEISLPREPCSKIDMVLGTKNLCSKMVKDCKSGFYLRVLKEGFISKDCEFELLERKNPKYSIRYINQCFYFPKQHQEGIKELLSCDELADKFKKSLEKKLKKEKL